MAKLNHKLNIKNKITHNKKQIQLSEMTADLEAKGYDVNKESLRSRSKVRRSISQVEEGQDRFAKRVLDSDSDDGMIVDDDKLAAKEAKDRGRLKKRTRNAKDSDIDMSDDGEEKAGNKARSMTPAQRHISAQKSIRSMTKDRREGTVPKRRADKPVPESHVRLAQKIEKKVFRTNLFASTADRH